MVKVDLSARVIRADVDRFGERDEFKRLHFNNLHCCCDRVVLVVRLVEQRIIVLRPLESILAI